VNDTLYGLSIKASGQFFALDPKPARSCGAASQRGDEHGNGQSRQLLFLLNEDGKLTVARSSRSGRAAARVHRCDSATWASRRSWAPDFVKDVFTLTL